MVWVCGGIMLAVNAARVLRDPDPGAVRRNPDPGAVRRNQARSVKGAR